jgi:TonB-linked SusC/RagA family outer membrane protein
MHKILLILLAGIFGISSAFAQVISGKITDAKSGEPMIGVTVQVKGTTRGFLSDIDGVYKADVSNVSNPVLVFRFIGYAIKEEAVNARATIDIRLEEDVTLLTEVVVTAFGIQTEKKAINYALQDVSGVQVVETGQNNLINALQGKIAGAQITSSSGSPGASAHILIRGANSVDEGINNQPLYIIDGIPIDNSAAFGGTNRGFDINPNDIESITVLKSGTASALYGTEASNGAIVITTKRAKAGVSQVNFSASTSFDRAFRLHPRQQIYKQGNAGVYDPQSQSSWGPVIAPGEQTFDNVDNFLRWGVIQKYDVSAATGSDRNSVFVSANMLDHQGIFPGEDLKRIGFLLKGENKLSDKLTLETSMNYIHTKNNRTSIGSMNAVYGWPINDDMRITSNPDGSKRWLIDRPAGQEWSQRENPFWASRNQYIRDDINRIIAMSSLRYKITNDLTATYRYGGDIGYTHNKVVRRPGSAGTAELYSGTISESERFNNKITSTFLLQYDKKLSEKLELSGLVGHNVQWDNLRSTTISGIGYRNPDLDNLNNLQTFNLGSLQTLRYRRVFGVFTDLKVNYDGILFLGVTARNDWASTLSPNNRSFFYPSANIGFVFSELIDGLDFMNFGKLRASYAQIGKDAPVGRTQPYLDPFTGVNGGFVANFFSGNPNLRPEITKELELGGNFAFLNGRLKVDAAYYNLVTEDAIISSRVSPASGAIILVFNSGSIQNKGVELVIDYDVMRKTDFRWNAMANISGNRSTVIELPSFVSRFPVTAGQQISSARPISILDEPLLGLEGTTYLYNEFGQLVVDQNGNPRIGTYLKDANGNYLLNPDGTRVVDPTRVSLGNREPRAILGITNSLTYKRYSLSFLIDIRVGGDVLNATKSTMIGNGSAGYLEDYRNRTTVYNGVVELEGGGFAPNTQEVILNQTFFNNYYLPVGSNFVEDASWTRLRYATFSYNVPDAFAKKLGMRNMAFSVTGRNLFLITKYSGGDPEVNYAGSGVGGSGTVGLDFFNVPQVQGFDFAVRASF